MIGPLQLWLLAIVTAAFGLRARRAAQRATATGGETPSALRAAWRVPVPAAILRRSGRAGAAEDSPCRSRVTLHPARPMEVQAISRPADARGVVPALGPSSAEATVPSGSVTGVISRA